MVDNDSSSDESSTPDTDGGDYSDAEVTPAGDDYSDTPHFEDSANVND